MPSDVKFKEVERMLIALGYTLKRVRGSHHVFENQRGEIFVAPVHRGKVKYWYVKQIKQLSKGES